MTTRGVPLHLTHVCPDASLWPGQDTILRTHSPHVHGFPVGWQSVLTSSENSLERFWSCSVVVQWPVERPGLQSGSSGFDVSLYVDLGLTLPVTPQSQRGPWAGSVIFHPVTLIVRDSNQGLCFPQVTWMPVWQPRTWRTSCTVRRRTSCSCSGSMPARSRACTPRSGGCSNTAQVPGGPTTRGWGVGKGGRPAGAVAQSRTLTRAGSWWLAHQAE